MNVLAGKLLSRLGQLGVLFLCVIFTLGIADPTPRFLGISGTETTDDSAASAPLSVRPAEGVSPALRDPRPPIRARVVSSAARAARHRLDRTTAVADRLVVRGGSGPPLRC